MKERMLHGGLAKLVEELGECGQIVGKMLQYPDADFHPDSATFDNPKPMSQRLEEEIADVLAATRYVGEQHALDEQRIIERAERKYAQYVAWGNEGEAGES